VLNDERGREGEEDGSTAEERRTAHSAVVQNRANHKRELLPTLLTLKAYYTPSSWERAQG